MREEEVRYVVRQGGQTARQVIAKFFNESGRKVGTKAKVEEVLARNCDRDESGYLIWKG